MVTKSARVAARWARRDAEIYVVVPGDETAVADGAEHGAAKHVVGYAVLATDAVDEDGYVEQ